MKWDHREWARRSRRREIAVLLLARQALTFSYQRPLSSQWAGLASIILVQSLAQDSLWPRSTLTLAGLPTKIFFEFNTQALSTHYQKSFYKQLTFKLLYKTLPPLIPSYRGQHAGRCPRTHDGRDSWHVAGPRARREDRGFCQKQDAIVENHCHRKSERWWQVGLAPDQALTSLVAKDHPTLQIR